MLKDTVKKDSGHIRIAVKDYGPISKGEVILRPLTILVGPNGCGKTHISTLIHSAVESESERNQIDWSLKDEMFPKKERRWHLGNIAPTEILDKEARRIHEQNKQNATDVDSDISKYVADFWAKSFSDILQNVSNSLFESIRRGKDSFELNVTTKINDGKFRYPTLERKLGIPKIDFCSLKIKFKQYTDSKEWELDRMSRNGSIIHVNIPKVCDYDLIYNSLKKAVEFAAISRFNRGVFFPAERAGLMYFVPSFMSKYGTAENKLLTDNVKQLHVFSWITSISNTKSEFATIVEHFENSIIDGIVTASVDSMSGVNVEYVQNNNKWSLQISEAASYIKDIAYFLVYVKYVARQHDVIILEEPEINLHPKNQILLARLIVNLVNAGLYIVVSTHSPYFLEQLSHCVVGGMIKNKQSDVVLPDEQCIECDAVAVYRFAPDDKDGGYLIHSDAITEDGIAQTEFTNVDNSLYDELTALRLNDEYNT